LQPERAFVHLLPIIDSIEAFTIDTIRKNSLSTTLTASKMGLPGDALGRTRQPAESLH
jgi:hypothetical protein